MHRLALALTVGTAVLHSDAAPPLRVLRTTPAEGADASPTAPITITFDRPVAGSLEHTVDARALVRVEPAAPGTIEWRDPITIRFAPTAPLAPGAHYTITVDNHFRAMDGSQLATPVTLTFRVRPPTLLTGSPVRPREIARFVTPTSHFELVWSSAPDLARLSATAYLEFDPSCGGPRTIPLRALSSRRVTTADPSAYRNTPVARTDDHSADSLRAIVELAPQSPLPLACRGQLWAPKVVDEHEPPLPEHWPFETYSPLRFTYADCPSDDFCPTGPITVSFSTPVTGAQVLHHVTFVPATPFAVRDTTAESTTWALDARLTPRTTYAVVADTALRDAFGQALQGNPALSFATTGFEPTVDYPYGKQLVERAAFRTLAVQHVNVDTLVVTIAPVPDTLEASLLARPSWSLAQTWQELHPLAVVRRIAVPHEPDKGYVTAIPLPTFDPSRPHPATLFGVTITGVGNPATRPRRATTTRTTNRAARYAAPPVALLQVTDLAVHARVGADEGIVWVTGVSDGVPRAGAAVTLIDTAGHVVARAVTDHDGIAHLRDLTAATESSRAAAPVPDQTTHPDTRFTGYAAVRLGDDRAVLAVGGYEPDLSPWRFGVTEAWAESGIPAASAVFTERGIYRPGESVSAKAILRRGMLGALTLPRATDSLHWAITDREGAPLHDTTTALSSFGTAALTIPIALSAALGRYEIHVQARRLGRWHDVGTTDYRVAEYRPPEFLVDASSDSGTRFPGDTFHVRAQARYLFGAPMARAALRWEARQRPLSPWELSVSGIEDYEIGDAGFSDDNTNGSVDDASAVRVFASGTDTLDATGRRDLRVALPRPTSSTGADVTVQATITDVNRQTVVASTATTVHASAFYIAAKSLGANYFWSAGTPQTVAVLAVRPDGARVPGVAVRGTVVRREWRQVRRVRSGLSELVGEWVSDTVGRCDLTTAKDPVVCRVTPTAGGEYMVRFAAVDNGGRPLTTSLVRWVTGAGWVPWNDDSQFKMDLIADRKHYAVGDTATVLVASPFTNAEAWVTVEREGLIEQRRMRLTAGSTALKFAITEAYAPNAFVSVIVARGRSATPGPLDDPGRPTIRVGYADLRVTPEVKRLDVRLTPAATEYRPGDTARVAVLVRDAHGSGQRSEVTLWAVDEGVLALTGYRTPDPIDLLYAPRGVGLRLASTLAAVAPQVPEGKKGGRSPGGGGGADGAQVLRSQFRSTAFFLSSVVTDSTGAAVALARLPDNLTTFRVMAVAVTAGDRYGSGQSTLLVTRPLLARPALPRFVRPGDAFAAGAVVNARSGAAVPVTVTASASHAVELQGRAEQRTTLEPGRGREVRFPFRAPPADTAGDAARVRFAVRGTQASTLADLVDSRLPVRPDYHPRAHTIAGVLRDSATIVFHLPAGTDPVRSRLAFSGGPSALAVVRRAARLLSVYPYDCTEQVTSAARPILALYITDMAATAKPNLATPSDEVSHLRADIETAVSVLSHRQRGDGGIGLWGADDWTTPWLSAYAGLFLVEARDAGIPVRDSVLAGIARYLVSAVHAAQPPREGSPDFWSANQIAAWLSERVAAADYLSRAGRPDVAIEHELLRLNVQMWSADRSRLAAVLARRADGVAAARELLAPMWAAVRVEGSRAVLPDTMPRSFYFWSALRSPAELLVATLAIDPTNALVGPLVETVTTEERALGPWAYVWTTQDLGEVVTALAAFDRHQREAHARGLTVRAANQMVLQSADSSVPLTGLITRDGMVTLTLTAGPGAAPLFYALTVNEVPRTQPVTPDDEGIQIERWYEPYDVAKPIGSATEGDLIRVRLRVTVPSDRPFVVIDDALPAGLEAVDLSLRTAGLPLGPGGTGNDGGENGLEAERGWGYGSWDDGWWSPFDHKEIRDERVVYFATMLWAGTYTTSYVARATTPGTFIRPPATAEEMYNPSVQGRTEGGTFTVTARAK